MLRREGTLLKKGLQPSIVFLGGLMASLAFAQLTPIDPKTAASEEGREVRVAYTLQGNTLSPANLLDLIYQCTRPLGAYINIGGKLYLRVYEFDTISLTIYRMSGIKSVSNAIRRAEVKARGSAVKILNGTAVYVSETAGDLEINEAVAQEAQTSGGERVGIAKVSNEQKSFFGSITESTAQGFLRGATVTGTKIISLGDAGICVMVRLDVPLNQNQGGGSVPGQGGGGSGGSGESAPFNPGGAPPLPPGSVGDW